MNTIEIQQQLFQYIKTKLPQDASVADEVAKLLGISSDSAYRRMRGEKLITFEELHALATQYKISLDQLMNIQTGGILFQGQFLDKKNFRFEDYVSNAMHNMAYINSFKEKELYYNCKDLPLFHHYHLREIAAFKWFFWLKTYFQFPEFEKRKFNFSDYPEELFAMEQKALNMYNEMPSTEIWNIESMNIIFRQVEFYRNAEVFESDADAFRVYDAVEKLWGHLEEQAALGYKFNIDDPQKKPMGGFKMYFNEVSLGDNTVFAILDGVKICYIIHTNINFMITRDVAFNENMYRYIQNLMKKATLISAVSEKERSRFFRIIRERLQKRKEALDV
jgi:hypothetical protein